MKKSALWRGAMKPIHLGRFDLNLLVVLNRVYVEGAPRALQRA
jgi:hypothetical protein